MQNLLKGDLWVQSPMIIVGQSPNIRSIAENRRRSQAIAGDLPKRIVGLCPLGRALWLALPKAICQSCSLQLCSPKINSPN